MTSSLLAEKQGAQKPRVSWTPPYSQSTAPEALELLAVAGIELDPWQEFVLSESLGEDENGRWSAFELGLCCPRQNGKNEILLAREIIGLYLLDERLIIHSAHQFDTSLEAFRRLKDIVENVPALHKRVKPRGIKNSHGEEGIELKGGQRIRFRTRTKGGGRGFTGDCVIFDEAMEFPESAHGAILPTLSARSIIGDPQVWYTGSAVDQWIHDNGVVFARVRERAMNEDSALAYFEWSIDAEDPQRVEDPTDPDLWAEANPGLGIRISTEHVAREQRSMDPRTFAVERLGVGDWPSTNPDDDQVIPPETVATCTDGNSKVQDPVTFAYDVTPDRSRTAIAVSGRRSDGLTHIEVIDHRSGTGWVVDALVTLTENHKGSKVRCDGYGAGESLIPKLEERGVEVEVVSAKENTQACGELFDAFEQTSVRHRGTAELLAAFKGARKRPLGDAWAWSRKNSTVDICPLVACTLAHWGASTEPKAQEPLVAWRSR